MSKEFFLKTKECLTKANYTSPKIKDLYIKCKSLSDGLCEDNVFEFFSELCDEVERLYNIEQEVSLEKIEELKDEIDKLNNTIDCLNKIYNEDCLEGMKAIPDGSIDMILCDLPYGTTACKWDNIIPFEPLWEQYHRVIKDNGAIVLFGSEPFSSALRMSNIKSYKYDLYWKKEKPTNFFQLKKRFGKCTENIIIFYSKQPTYNPQKYKHEGKLVKNNPKGNHNSIVAGINKKVFPYNDDGTRYPNDILEFRRDVLGTTIHPTQKPVALLEYLIKTYTNEGQTVLDNCMGSGSTAIACINTNRNYIGFEKDTTYFEIAKKRIEESQIGLC